MDGILTDGRHGKLWMCKRKDGHVLGIILEDKKDGHMVERLLLFRAAKSLDFVEPDTGTVAFNSQTKTIALIEGTTHDIECDLCDSKRTWWMDKKITLGLLAPLYGKG
jgi:hypothetical protein